MTDMEQVERAAQVSDFQLWFAAGASTGLLVLITVQPELARVVVIAFEYTFVHFFILRNIERLPLLHLVDDGFRQGFGLTQVVASTVELRAFDGSGRDVQDTILGSGHLQFHVQAFDGLAKCGFGGSVSGKKRRTDESSNASHHGATE